MSKRHPANQQPTRAKKAAIRAGLLLEALAVCLGLWACAPRSPAPPVIDFAKFDPTVARTLQSRRDEVLRQPRSAAAWGWLGALLWAYDLRPPARECLAQAERLEPDNPRWPYYHALSLMIATPNDAIPLLQRTVQLCGSSPEAPRFRLAYLLAEQGRWGDSKREFQALLAEHPDFTPARLLAAREAHARGDADQAIELARKCEDTPQTARSALNLLATVHRQKGDAAAAAEAARRLALAPPEEAVADPFHAEVILLRGDPRALSEQAHPLLAAGRLTEAQPLVDRLQQEHPDFAETWLLAGRLQLLRKDLAFAEQSLRKHVQMNPRSAQGVFQLGMVLLAREQWTNAAAVFEQAIQLKPDFGPAYYNRGLALAHAGDRAGAIDAFRESLRNNPERLESYLYLAELSMRNGQREAALKILGQANALNPNDARVKSLRQRILRDQ